MALIVPLGFLPSPVISSMCLSRNPLLSQQHDIGQNKACPPFKAVSLQKRSSLSEVSKLLQLTPLSSVEAYASLHFSTCKLDS